MITVRALPRKASPAATSLFVTIRTCSVTTKIIRTNPKTESRDIRPVTSGLRIRRPPRRSPPRSHRPAARCNDGRLSQSSPSIQITAHRVSKRARQLGAPSPTLADDQADVAGYPPTTPITHLARNTRARHSLSGLPLEPCAVQHPTGTPTNPLPRLTPDHGTDRTFASSTRRPR